VALPAEDLGTGKGEPTGGEAEEGQGLESDLVERLSTGRVVILAGARGMLCNYLD
jgi:hypothetical protein